MQERKLIMCTSSCIIRPQISRRPRWPWPSVPSDLAVVPSKSDRVSPPRWQCPFFLLAVVPYTYTWSHIDCPHSARYTENGMESDTHVVSWSFTFDRSTALHHPHACICRVHVHALCMHTLNPLRTGSLARAMQTARSQARYSQYYQATPGGLSNNLT